MRSRPAVDVRLVPDKVIPGEAFEVIATFVSRSKTPIDVIEFQLDGPLYQPPNHPAYFANHGAVHLVERRVPREFDAGRHQVRARFTVPSDSPPSYLSPGLSIEYVLSLHVDIPWWPDVAKNCVVPVVLPPSTERTAMPGSFSTDSRGPQDRKLYAEASLDDVVVQTGGVVIGEVSFRHTTLQRIDGVSVALVSRVASNNSAEELETERYVTPICSGVPPESEAVPFRVRVPADVTPAFNTPWAKISWKLEVTIETGWSRHVLLVIPIRVVPMSLGGPRAGGLSGAATSGGREARMQSWSTVAQQLEMQYDTADETLRFARGGLMGSITLEQRADGLKLCAAIAWPSLGLDLEGGPVQRTGPFDFPGLHTGVHLFDLPFPVRGRSEEQVRAMLTPELREVLRTLRDVRLDDTGLRFAGANAGVDLRQLSAFASRVAGILPLLEAAFANVPPPEPLAADRAAWARFAERLGGRLEVGRMWIHDGSFGMELVEVGNQWSREGWFEATVLRVHFEEPIAASYDPDESVEEPDAMRMLAREIAREARFARFGPDAVVVELAEMFSDPSRLEAHLDRIARVARHIRGRSEAGPYRGGGQ